MSIFILEGLWGTLGQKKIDSPWNMGCTSNFTLFSKKYFRSSDLQYNISFIHHYTHFGCLGSSLMNVMSFLGTLRYIFAVLRSSWVWFKTLAFNFNEYLSWWVFTRLPAPCLNHVASEIYLPVLLTFAIVFHCFGCN